MNTRISTFVLLVLATLLGLILVTGCTSLFLEEPLGAEIIHGDSPVLIHEQVVFKAKTNYPGEATCRWDFDDDTAIAEGEEITHIFKNVGNHHVTITVIRGLEEVIVSSVVRVCAPPVNFSAHIRSLASGNIAICDDVAIVLRFAPGEVQRIQLSWGDGDSNEILLEPTNSSSGYISTHQYNTSGKHEITIIVDGVEQMCLAAIRTLFVHVEESVNVFSDIQTCGCQKETLPSGKTVNSCDTIREV